MVKFFSPSSIHFVQTNPCKLCFIEVLKYKKLFSLCSDNMLYTLWLQSGELKNINYLLIIAAVCGGNIFVTFDNSQIAKKNRQPSQRISKTAALVGCSWSAGFTSVKQFKEGTVGHRCT